MRSRCKSTASLTFTIKTWQSSRQRGTRAAARYTSARRCASWKENSRVLMTDALKFTLLKGLWTYILKSSTMEVTRLTVRSSPSRWCTAKQKESTSLKTLKWICHLESCKKQLKPYVSWTTSKSRVRILNNWSTSCRSKTKKRKRRWKKWNSEKPKKSKTKPRRWSKLTSAIRLRKVPRCSDR